MKMIFRFTSVIIMLLGLTSCSDADVLYKSKILLLLKGFNKNITIELSERWNTYEMGDNIQFDIMNLTESQIQITPDQDIRIFQQYSNTWLEIDNRIDYCSAIDIVPTIETDPLGMGFLMFIVIPDVIGDLQTTTVRIVVLGTLLDEIGNPTETRVGAFVDVSLHTPCEGCPQSGIMKTSNLFPGTLP